MLRRLSSRTYTFFSSGLTNSANYVKIYIDEVVHDKYIEPTNRIKAFHDKNDQCMKKFVHDFAITEAEQLGFKRNQFQIEFQLPALDNIDIKVITKEKVDVTALDKHYLISKCIAESLLKMLYKHKLITNDAFVFEGTRGSQILDHFSIYTNRLYMNNKPDGESSTSNDVVSRVDAKLDEGKIQILLNTVNTKTLDTIREIYSELFKERILQPAADSGTMKL